jgi:hypothetical protein
MLKIQTMKTLLLSVLLLVSIDVFSQSNDECKYFTVLTYLNTNKAINKQIKEYYNFGKANKSRFLDMNVTAWIEFMEIYEFKNKIIPDSIGLSKEIVSDDRLYFKTYNFEPFKSVLLSETIEENDSKLYLTFSKVIGNSLLIEILTSKNDFPRGRRRGGGVKILFVFNPSGSIKTVLLNTVVYN